MPAPSPSTAAQAALDALAAALDPSNFATTLVTGPGRTPHLAVSSRHAQLSEDIYADDQSYWWPWSERITAIDDPLTAAQKVADVLRTAPEPAHG